MAVTANALKEYLRLPPDSVEITGGTVDAAAFIEKVKAGGTYIFTEDGGWTLGGSAVTLSEYGITADEYATEIVVDYEAISVDIYLSAAKSKARTAGITDFQNNAQYDLFILALAAMYYENRAMMFDGTRPDFLETSAKNIINSFVHELRYAEEDQ